MVLGLPSLCGPQPRGFRRRGREAQRTIASAVRPLDNAQGWGVGEWGSANAEPPSLLFFFFSFLPHIETKKIIWLLLVI